MIDHPESVATASCDVVGRVVASILVRPGVDPMNETETLVTPRGRLAVLTLLAVATAMLASACRSLDPNGELARAHELANSRIAITTSDGSPPADWHAERPLTAAEAIEIGLRHAPAIIAARPTLAAARAALVEASQPPNPVFRWMVGVPIDSVEAVPFFLGVAQDLGYLLQRDALIEVAELDLEREVLSAAQRFVEKAFEIESLHRAALAAQEQHRLALEQATLAASILRLAEDREFVGEGIPSDTALAQARRRHAEAQAAEARRIEQQSKLALLKAMGRPGLSLDWSVARELASAEPVEPWHGGTDSASGDPRSIESWLVRTALGNRLDLLASDLAACSRFESIGIAANSIWNSLSFGVGFDRDMEGMRGVPFSGAVPIPIFDDGSVPRARAEAAWQLAMIDRFELAQTIEAEVRAAWIDSIAASSALEAREHELRELERAADSIRAAYDGGFESLAEVLLLDARCLEVHRDVIAAREDLDLSRIALRRAVGGVPDPSEGASGSVIASDRSGRSLEDPS